VAEVAAVTAAGRRSLLGKLSAVHVPRPGRRSRALAVKAAAAARDHLTTVAALAAIDLGCFEASRVAGWVAGGVCLLVLDFKVRG
jgi:hypothetical protein